jgi:sugar phosphate isomerase/epimerase
MSVANYHIDEAHVWDPDPEVRERSYQVLLRHLDVAEALGASTVRIDFGSRESEMSEEQFDVLVRRYGEFARRAADNGYRVGPETHFGPSLVVANMKRVLDAVDNPAYGILLHIGHWAPGQEDAGDKWAAPHAMHTHVDARITSTCLTEKMNLLIDSGYQGYWGVEHHSARNEHAEVALQLAAVRRALAAK